MNQRNAQIQMGETIFAVIIIIVIIIFILVFYSNAQEKDFSQQQTTFVDLASISLAQYVGALPELGCSQREVKDLSCFDITKLSAFVTTSELHPRLTEEYYATQLGTVLIQVHEIYPDHQTWTLYNNSLNQSIANSRQVQKPVSLLNSVTGKHSFGILHITLYRRR
jgi:hypothetical protein